MNYIKQDVFNVGEGAAILCWPVDMSKDSFEDFSDWLFLQHRKIKRNVENNLKSNKQQNFMKIIKRLQLLSEYTIMHNPDEMGVDNEDP